MNPPGQSSTEALHTITLLIYIYIHIHTEREGRWTAPHQSSTEALHTATLLIYIYRERGDMDPHSIEHTGLAYHYTAYVYI